MGEGRLIKRSLTLKGHRTSLALEAPFWTALEQLAARRGLSVPQLVLGADLDREAGLASAVRVMTLEAALSGEISTEAKLGAP